MDQIELLEEILAKTAGVIEAIRPDQLVLPTPCPEYDVGRLVDHVLGWVRVFDAAANGLLFEGDPDSQRPDDDPAGEFREASSSMLAGWRRNGLDRPVRLRARELPGPTVFNMALMEYLTHGWDLAIATGQQAPFGDREASEVLARAEGTLPAQYRGEGMPFGPVVPVDANAPPLARLVAFMGRQP